MTYYISPIQVTTYIKQTIDIQRSDRTLFSNGGGWSPSVWSKFISPQKEFSFIFLLTGNVYQMNYW